MKTTKILLTSAFLLLGAFSAMGLSGSAANPKWFSASLMNIAESFNQSADYDLIKPLTVDVGFSEAITQDDSLAPQSGRPDILWMRGGQSSASTGLTYIQNGQLLVSFSNDQVIKIFRVSDGILLRSIAVPDSLGSGDYNAGFAVSIDGQRVAIGTSNNGAYAIKIFSISDGSLLLSIPTNFAPLSISFSPANNQIIAGASTGGNWNTAAMFDSVNGNFIRFIMHGGLRVGGYVAFSPDGQTFVAHAELTGLSLFNASTGAWIKSYGNIYGIVSFSPDGMKLATANGGNVTVFPALCAPGSCNAIFSGVAGNSNPAFSSNSQLLAINYGSGRIRVWNTSNTAVGWSQNNDYVITQNGYNISYGSRLAFAPDNTLASAASQITLSNVGNGALIRNLTPMAYSSVPSLSFSADGQTLATVNYNAVSSGDSIQLWNVADGSRRNVSFPQSIGLNPAQIFIAPDNQTLLTLDNGNVKFWNAANGSLIRDVPQSTPSSPAGAISLSPDGQIYAVGKTLGQATPVTDFYRTSDDSPIRRLNHGGGSGSAFSPNSQLFATGQINQSGGSSKIKIFNVSDGTERQTLNLSANLSQIFPNIAFSPDNQTVAVIEDLLQNNQMGIIELFRVSDGTLLQTLGTFGGRGGASVAFAPDGQTVIGTGWDATVRIWRVSDGVLLQTYDQETGLSATTRPLYQIAYSPDGSRFAYGRRDATVVMARNPYQTFTISGNITRGGSAFSGVSVALSGAGSATVMTDASGNYSFANLTSGSNYTVTPTLANYTFAPVNRSFSNLAANQTEQNFVGTATCTYALNPTSTNVGNIAGSGSFNVTTQAGCAWTAQSNSAFLTTSSTGNTSGTVSYAYAANAGAARSATITVGGQTFTFNQAPGTIRRTPFDFDGDGRADVSVFRPSNGIWYFNNSQTGFSGVGFGLGTDKLVPADYDGDGKTDVAVFRSGIWYIQRSSAGFTAVTFGNPDDILVPADYDGDGKADVAVFRPSNGTWYRLNSSNGQFTFDVFGISTDKPVPADYDGDGRANVAVFRPSNGTWYTSTNPATNYGAVIFGDANDKLVPADYDGDGKTDVAVFRPSNGTWYIQRSQAGFTGIAFGLGTDLPVAADYDGDGEADVAVFRNGTWYLNRTNQGFIGVAFGAATDKPIPNVFVR